MGKIIVMFENEDKELNMILLMNNIGKQIQ